MRVASAVAVPALLVLLALPLRGAAKEGPEDAAAGPGADGAPTVAAEGEPEVVPATGEPDATAVPATGSREAAPQIAGPTGSLPGLPVPAVAPGGPAPVEPSDDVLAFRPEVVVPFGDWADVTGVGLGLHVAYDHRATDRLTWTGRLGYVVHLEDEKRIGGRHTDLHTHEVPLLAGVRYAPLPGLYGAVEAGLVHFRYESETSADVATEGGFRLGGTVGAGYRLGDFDLGARLFLPDLVGRDEGVALSTGLSFQVGYAFADL